MFCAVLRQIVGQSYRVSASRTSHVILCALLLLLAAVPAFADSDSTAHLLIGMTPNQGFEVSCEDSVLFLNPVVADELGILSFDVEGRLGPPPNTVCVRIPAPPQIAEESVSTLGDTAAVVSWMTDRPATSRVEYGPTPYYGKTTPEFPALVVSHDVPLWNLSAETTYHYRVVSKDAFGNLTAGTDHTFVTMPLATMLSGVASSDVLEASFDVSWTTSRPCNASVQYGQTQNYGHETTPTAEFSTEHRVTVDGLLPGTVYHFRAVSLDDLGRTVRSADSIVTTQGGQLAMYDLAIGDTSSVGATITWTTSSPASSWVMYGTEEYCDHQCGTDELVAQHSVTLSDLAPNTLYRYFVLSRDASGAAAQSEERFFSTECSPLQMAGPHVASTTLTTITLSWTTSRPADGVVEYGDDETYDEFVWADTSLTTGHEVTIVDLEPGGEYHVRATSTDEFGCAAVSEDHVVHTQMPALSVFGVTVPETTAVSATVNWRTTNASFCYVEYGATESYGFATDESPFALTEHAVVLGDLLPRTHYHFRVHAVDVFGQQIFSPDFGLTTPGQDGPGGLLVYGVVANPINPTFASICWQTNEPASSTVQYGLASNCDLSVTDYEMTRMHCLVITGLSPNTRYYYRVSSTDGASLQAQSQLYSFRTPATDVVAPGCPDGLAAASCQDGIRLLWSPGQEYDLNGYRIYRRSDGGTSFELLVDLPTGQTSYIDRHVLDRWSYDYAIAAYDQSGNESGHSIAVSASAGLGEYGRAWVYPNPVTQKQTTVSFNPPAGGGSYTISIYDARGRLVRSLDHGNASDRVSSTQWDTRDNTGFPVPSGTYFCVIAFPEASIRTKIMVIR